MKPSAPVTTTIGSEPLPAVQAIEAPAAAHEPADVPQALARGVPAVMADLDGRHVRGLGDAVEPHAPVEVLEVQEELGIEAAGAVDRDRACTSMNAPDSAGMPITSCGGSSSDDVAHLVAIEAAPEQRGA